VYHNLEGKGEFGAQMCLQSGWLERRKRDIERAYRELGFDGIYYDWVMQLACNNSGHNVRLHTGTDGVIDLLAWTRRLIGDHGTLILHLYGMMPSMAFENFADLVVNMEEISGAEKWMRVGDTPLVTVLAESIPRSPCPSYREDSARDRNRNNIAQLVLLGMFPWAVGTGERSTRRPSSCSAPSNLTNWKNTVSATAGPARFALPGKTSSAPSTRKEVARWWSSRTPPRSPAGMWSGESSPRRSGFPARACASAALVARSRWWTSVPSGTDLWSPRWMDTSIGSLNWSRPFEPEKQDTKCGTQHVVRRSLSVCAPD